MQKDKKGAYSTNLAPELGRGESHDVGPDRFGVGSTPSHHQWLPHACFTQLVSSMKAIESELFGGISLGKPIYP
jgi:hypothetical protein